MTETFSAQSLPLARADRYAQLAQEIAAVLEGETNLIARMASVTAMLSATFSHFFWTGFYLVDPLRDRELVVGPYQGTLGCLRIAFDRGVCGAAATQRRTLIVTDVLAFPGHIACDAASRSEIVVPVFAPDQSLVGVLDVDATTLAAFDGVDARGLEVIVELICGAGFSQAAS